MRCSRDRIRSERGFTLVELLLVVLLIGILTAIAFPAFLGQQKKGEDVSAKSNARSAVSVIELCYHETRNYSSCDTPADLEALGMRLPAQVTDTTTKLKGAISLTATANTYTIVGYSESNNAFAITKSADGTTRSCTTGGQGGCESDAVW